MHYAPVTPAPSSVRAISRSVKGGKSESRYGVRKSHRVTRLLRSQAIAVARVLNPACYSVSIFGSGADYAGY